MTTLLTIDPGEVTGVSYGSFYEKLHYKRHHYWLVRGGPQGLADFLRWFLQEFGQPDHTVVERFVPDGTAGGRMTVAPRCEGVIIALLGMPEWQLRSDKTWGGNSISENDDRLQAVGLWVTGSDLDHEDGRDVNDSALHAIAWLRNRSHAPTLRWIFGQ